MAFVFLQTKMFQLYAQVVFRQWHKRIPFPPTSKHGPPKPKESMAGFQCGLCQYRLVSHTEPASNCFHMCDVIKLQPWTLGSHLESKRFAKHIALRRLGIVKRCIWQLFKNRSDYRKKIWLPIQFFCLFSVALCQQLLISYSVNVDGLFWS